jgi:EpsI family protein
MSDEARISRGPSRVQLIVLVAILGAGVALTARTSGVMRVSAAGIRLVDGRPVLVERAGDWTGGPAEGLTEIERRILPADTEGVRRIYRDNAGHQVYCSIVLAGREVTSIHRPELCLTGQDWMIQGERAESIPAAGAPGSVLSVMRVNAKRRVPRPDGGVGFAHSIFVYWFVGKDRVTPHHYQRIFWTARDRVWHNTNHRWAYILVHVPVALDWETSDLAAAEQQAMKVVANFVQNIYPDLASN